MNKVKKMARYHWDLNRIKEKIKIVEEAIDAIQKRPNSRYTEYVIENLTQIKNIYHFLLSYYNISKSSDVFLRFTLLRF